MTTSGTTLFQPPIADLVVEAFSRIQIRGSELTPTHIIEARRSANLILQDWSGNRSVNLWAVDLLQIPCVTGVSQYQLPADTIQVLDVYIRQYAANTTFTTIGNTLTPQLMNGVPMLTSWGDPLVQGPGSGTLSTTQGSQIVTVTWPQHGLSAGSPIFFNMPVTCGGITLQGFYPVYQVIDSNNVTVLVSQAAIATSPGMGSPPLFGTTSGSATITAYLAGHGYAVGETFAVQNATTVGGVTIAAENYTIAAVPNSDSFTFSTGSIAATSTTAAFEFGGQIQVTSQQANNNPIDIIMYGLSRSEYAAIPDKLDQGRPTSFWYDRLVPPSMYIWQVPPSNQTYGVAVYRMRQIQDANPISGQTADMPNRFLPVFTAELTAALAEKFSPALFVEKAKIAEAMWIRAAQEDREIVPLYITPGLSGYFN